MNAAEWERKIEEERARYLPAPRRSPPATHPVDPTSIILGMNGLREPVQLPLRVRLEHVLCVGATGGGKSRAITHYGRQIIRRGEGGIFIDPHGSHEDSTFRALLLEATAYGRQIRIVDFTSGATVGFNPLHCPTDTDPWVIVAMVRSAFIRLWDAKSFSAYPTIERVLNTALYTAVELGLTLCELEALLDREDAFGLRRQAIEQVRDTRVRRQLQQLDELAKDSRRRREYEQEVVGPINRVSRVLGPKVLRAALGQKERCIDLRAAMDNNEIVLVNLAGGTDVEDEDADLFGRLLIRTLLFEAKRRKTRTPFNAVFDEAHRFLTPDIGRLLAEVRKFSVSVFSSITWLNQAEQNDPAILAALLNGTNTKIIFRLRDADEAERIARSNVPLNLERPVAALTKPTTIGHRRIRLANENEGVNSSVTLNESETDTTGRTVTESGTEGYALARSESESESEGHTTTESDTAGESSGEGENESEVLMPTDDEPIVSRTTAGTNTNTGRSKASTTGKAHSTGKTTTTGTVETDSYTRGRAVSDSASHAVTRGSARTTGQSAASGSSEALEPIMEMLPTAVHSLQNELYAAGALLMRLPTATGYVSYVGSRGPVATLFTVPPVYTKPIPHEAFADLRDKVLKANGAIPTDEALRFIEERLTQPEAKRTKPKSARRLSPRAKLDKGEKLW